MFRCHNCSNVVPPKTICKKIILAWRVKHYPQRQADSRNGIVIHRPLAYIDEKGKRRLRYPSDPGGTGWEVEREGHFCPHCAAEHERRERELEGVLV